MVCGFGGREEWRMPETRACSGRLPCVIVRPHKVYLRAT